MGRVFVLVALLALGGCAAPVKQLWVRTDGQTTRESPHLLPEYEIAMASCQGEMAKANMSGAQFCRGMVDCVSQGVARDQQALVVGKGCMAEKGYVLVPEEEAQAKADEFKAARAAAEAAKAAQTRPATKAARR